VTLRLSITYYRDLQVESPTTNQRDYDREQG